MADIRIGIIGLSEGNGHPFSFGSIINGYSPVGLADSGWQVIYDYVRRRDASEFGIPGCQVTHAWTQDTEITQKLCAAALIPHAVRRPQDMLGGVDAVIVARDDYETHLPLALPFLEAGTAVFIDKPLSLDVGELRRFLPFLQSGKLMSCSAMRYARELDELKANIAAYGPLKLVRGAVLNSWEKYGVHLLEAVASLIDTRFTWIQALDAPHSSMAIGTEEGPLVQIDALGQTVATFQLDVWGTAAASSHRVTDNFTMFRRMLWHFVHSIKSGQPAVLPEETIAIMKVLIAGGRSAEEQRKVYIDEVSV